MFFYKAYGLNIRSHLQLPELNPSKGEPDVHVDFGEVHFSGDKPSDYGTRYEVTPYEIKLSWNGVASFRLIKGQKVIVDPVKRVDENILKEVLLGPVFAVLLHQRGNLVLHASAVNINNKAAAFLGYAGSGKSTISLEMYKRGYGLITDDILAVNIDMDDIIVYPSFPMIKLESDDLLKDINNSEIVKKESNLDKNYYFLKNNFSTSPIPLETLYIIKRNNNLGIEDLNAQKALIEMLPNYYCLKLFQNDDKSANLLQCAHLLKNIKVKLLNLGNSQEHLPEIIDIVEDDVLD